MSNIELLFVDLYNSDIARKKLNNNMCGLYVRVMICVVSMSEIE